MLKRDIKRASQSAVAMIAIGLIWSSAVKAADLSIAAFSGHWQGSGLSESEVSSTFRLTARDLDVTIKPTADGFALTTTTVQRKKGDPNNPKAVRKTTEVTFRPGAKPGIWLGGSNRDPMAADAYVWARIKGQTLIVHALRVDDDGASNQLIYRRTLSASGMALNFQRLVDGELVRTVKGRLVKTAD